MLAEHMMKLPLYLAFIGVSVSCLAIAVAIFTAVTPYDEIGLIRQGNLGAGISFAGTVIALAIVVGTIGANTHDLGELALWSAIGLVIQLIGFLVARTLMPNLISRIQTEGCAAHGITLASIQIGLALLNSGALTP